MGEAMLDRAVLPAILSALHDPAVLARLPPGELDFTLRVLRRARLLGRLAWHTRELRLLDHVSPQARQALLGALALAEARSRLARWELDRVAWALEDLDDLPLVAMKGSAYMLAGLPHAAGRFFADVDLLVPQSRLRDVEARLAARGWRAGELTPYDENYYRLWTHELPPLRHEEREVEVDLHHGIVMRTSRFWSDPAPLVAAARPVPGSRFSVLAPVDMTLHAIAHLFAGGEMDDALRELVDIDGLLTHYGREEPRFWDELWPRASRLGLQRPTFYALRYAARLLGTGVPADLMRAAARAAPPRPALGLMDRLVPRTLIPRHPDSPDRQAALARLMLFVRTHWVRMPPLMLARHLAYKFYVRRLRRLNRPAQPRDSRSVADK
jgi:hypothetical protein